MYNKGYFLRYQAWGIVISFFLLVNQKDKIYDKVSKLLLGLKNSCNSANFVKMQEVNLWYFSSSLVSLSPVQHVL